MSDGIKWGDHQTVMSTEVSPSTLATTFYSTIVARVAKVEKQPLVSEASIPYLDSYLLGLRSLLITPGCPCRDEAVALLEQTTERGFCSIGLISNLFKINYGGFYAARCLILGFIWSGNPSSKHSSTCSFLRSSMHWLLDIAWTERHMICAFIGALYS